MWMLKQQEFIFQIPSVLAFPRLLLYTRMQRVNWGMIIAFSCSYPQWYAFKQHYLNNLLIFKCDIHSCVRYMFQDCLSVNEGLQRAYIFKLLHESKNTASFLWKPCGCYICYYQWITNIFCCWKFSKVYILPTSLNCCFLENDFDFVFDEQKMLLNRHNQSEELLKIVTHFEQCTWQKYKSSSQ